MQWKLARCAGDLVHAKHDSTASLVASFVDSYEKLCPLFKYQF